MSPFLYFLSSRTRSKLHSIPTTFLTFCCSSLSKKKGFLCQAEQNHTYWLSFLVPFLLVFTLYKKRTIYTSLLALFHKKLWVMAYGLSIFKHGLLSIFVHMEFQFICIAFSVRKCLYIFHDKFKKSNSFPIFRRRNLANSFDSSKY